MACRVEIGEVDRHPSGLHIGGYRARFRVPGEGVNYCVVIGDEIEGHYPIWGFRESWRFPEYWDSRKIIGIAHSLQEANEKSYQKVVEYAGEVASKEGFVVVDQTGRNNELESLANSSNA